VLYLSHRGGVQLCLSQMEGFELCLPTGGEGFSVSFPAGDEHFKVTMRRSFEAGQPCCETPDAFSQFLCAIV
jgi:hypothetical protein